MWIVAPTKTLLVKGFQESDSTFAFNLLRWKKKSCGQLLICLIADLLLRVSANVTNENTDQHWNTALSVWNLSFVFSYWFHLLCVMSWRSGLEMTKDEEFVPSPGPGISYQTACAYLRVCVCVRACRGIHCQDSDRFLFVHKLLLVISSIFETIKQRRENGWLGNPWILICQQNENESGRWWKCAEWEVTADMRKEQTFFFLVLFVPDCSHLLLSQVHTMACDLLPRVWNCSECEWKCQWDSCARCTSNKYKIWRQKKKKNPQASDRLCYDCTSGYGLHSSQQASRL